MDTKALDPINGSLWALGTIDPALALFAELRQNLRSSNALVSLDRAISVYLQGQVNELLIACAMLQPDADMRIQTVLDHQDTLDITRMAVTLTDDPLILEIAGYAMHLSGLTLNGTTPWRRFAAVIDHCYCQLPLQPTAAPERVTVTVGGIAFPIMDPATVTVGELLSS